MKKILFLTFFLSIALFCFPSLAFGLPIMEITVSVDHFRVPERSAILQLPDRPNTEFSLSSAFPQITVVKGNSTGTISVDDSSLTAVVGTGTDFSTLRVGDAITANGEAHAVSAITNDTHLTTDAWSGPFSNVGYTSTIARTVGLSTENYGGWIFQGNSMPGTISVTAGSNVVTGVGTNFTRSFWTGDTFTANGEIHSISGNPTNTELHTGENWATTASNINYGGGVAIIDFPYDSSRAPYKVYLELKVTQKESWHNMCNADCTPFVGTTGYYLQTLYSSYVGNGPQAGCPNPPCTENYNGAYVAVDPTHVISYAPSCYYYGCSPNYYWRSPVIETIN